MGVQLSPKRQSCSTFRPRFIGTALVGRLIGLGLGDPASAANNQAMIIEGVSTLLMLFAARRLGAQT
jgi:hypothetical protein